MEARTLDIGKAISEGWSAVWANPGAAIGGFVVYLLIAFVGGIIPIFGILFSLFVMPAFVGGFVILTLNLVNRNNPAIGNIFEGFNKYGQFLGAYWLYMLAVILCYIPMMLGFAVTGFSRHEDPGPAFVVLTLVSVVAVIVVCLRWAFVYFILAESSCGVVDAFKQSAAMTQGFRGKMFLAFLVLALIYLAGAIALLIGILITAPVVVCGTASLYNQLKTKKTAETAPASTP